MNKVALQDELNDAEKHRKSYIEAWGEDKYKTYISGLKEKLDKLKPPIIKRTTEREVKQEQKVRGKMK